MNAGCSVNDRFGPESGPNTQNSLSVSLLRSLSDLDRRAASFKILSHAAYRRRHPRALSLPKVGSDFAEVIRANITKEQYILIGHCIEL